MQKFSYMKGNIISLLIRTNKNTYFIDPLYTKKVIVFFNEINININSKFSKKKYAKKKL